MTWQLYLDFLEYLGRRLEVAVATDIDETRSYTYHEAVAETPASLGAIKRRCRNGGLEIRDTEIDEALLPSPHSLRATAISNLALGEPLNPVEQRRYPGHVAGMDPHSGYMWDPADCSHTVPVRAKARHVGRGALRQPHGAHRDSAHHRPPEGAARRHGTHRRRIDRGGLAHA